jgi:two-component system capsular synthesis sensor histidine kinase RcsC
MLISSTTDAHISDKQAREGPLFMKNTPENNAITDRELQITLVEDEPVELEIYRQKFASWGIPMKVTSAENGINALLRVSQSPPDLVITDLSMPIMDGFQMLRMFHQSIRSQNTHFVVITGLSLDEVRQRDDFPPGVTLLGKPVDFAQLEQIVRSRAEALPR